MHAHPFGQTSAAPAKNDLRGLQAAARTVHSSRHRQCTADHGESALGGWIKKGI